MKNLGYGLTLALNLHKTFDQCSIRSFGSANYPLHPQIFPATSLRKLPVTISAHPQICTSAFYPGLYRPLPDLNGKRTRVWCGLHTIRFIEITPGILGR